MKKYLVAMAIGAALGYIHNKNASIYFGAVGLPLLLLLWNIFTAPKPKPLPKVDLYRGWSQAGYASEDERGKR